MERFRKNKSWMFLVLLSIVTFATYFWVVFYADETANLPFIIPARIWYQNTYWQAEGLFMKPIRTYPPFDPIYSIQVVPTQQKDINTYQFWGKYLKVDSKKQSLYLSGFDGKTYSFKVSNNFIKSYNESFSFSKPIFYPTQDVMNVNGIPFTDNSVVSIGWDDKRSLFQVDKDFLQNISIPLNQNSTKIFVFIKIN